MTLLSWKDSYNTGITEIDSQHKQILDYINQLDEARKFKSKREIGDVIEGVCDYTMSHFAFEEALMEQANYPYAGPHKNVHETLIKRVATFKNRFDTGEDITSEFHSLLRRWLINHIQRDDAAYVKAVNVHLKNNESEQEQQQKTKPLSQKESWMKRAVKKFFAH